MRYLITFLLLASGAVLPAISQQLLSQLPPCAQTVGLSAISSTGCGLGDYACVCKDSNFIASFTSLIQNKCSAADIQTVKSFAENLCAGVGVTVNVPNVTATSPTAAGVSPTTTTSPAVIGASPTTGAASVMDRRGNAGNMFLVGVVGIIFPWLGF